MRLFRYEHFVGNGPYFHVEGLGSEHTESRKVHPGHEDFDYPYGNGLDGRIFASVTLDVLAEWFRGWHRRIRASGCILWEIEVPDSEVKIGKSGLQAIFYRQHCTKIRQIPATEHAGLEGYDASL